jgi:hypothetical protein
MSQAAPDAPVPFIPITVEADTPCRKCGYNLRGLLTDTQCPECGVIVAASISGDLLRYCPPDWVGTLARGAKFILAGVVVTILGGILAIILNAVLDPMASVVMPLTNLAGYALFVIGSWLVTTPDPSGSGEDKYGTARKLIRITLLIGVANQLLVAESRFVALPLTVKQIVQCIGAIAGLIGIIGIVAQLQYFQKLAGRIPDPSLVARAKFLKVWLPACYGTFLASSIGAVILFVFFGRKRTPGGAFVGFGCFLSIVGLAFLIFGIMYLFMINRFRRSFREQALIASRKWAAHEGG